MLGRPQLEIDRDVIMTHRRAGLRWSDISRIIGISERSLRRWRVRNDFEVIILNAFNILIMNNANR